MVGISDNLASFVAQIARLGVTLDMYQSEQPSWDSSFERNWRQSCYFGQTIIYWNHVIADLKAEGIFLKMRRFPANTAGYPSHVTTHIRFERISAVGGHTEATYADLWNQAQKQPLHAVPQTRGFRCLWTFNCKLVFSVNNKLVFLFPFTHTIVRNCVLRTLNCS